MLATDERVICATAANLFFVRNGRLHTPEIRDCGVAGVMRQQVLDAARRRSTSASRSVTSACPKLARRGRDLPHQRTDRDPAGDRGTRRGRLAARRAHARAAGPSRQPRAQSAMRRLLLAVVVARDARVRRCGGRISSLARATARDRRRAGRDRDSTRPAAAHDRAANSPSVAGSMHPRLLVAYARLTGADARVRAGEYRIEPGTTPRELLRQFAAGAVMQHAVTIVEGWTFPRPASGARARGASRADAPWSSTTPRSCSRWASRGSTPRGSSFRTPTCSARARADLEILRQARARMRIELAAAWSERAERPADRDAVRGADPRLDRREGNRARGGAAAHRRRIRGAPAARHAAADRSDRDLRHRPEVRRQPPALRPRARRPLQYLHARRTASDTDRPAGRRRAACSGAAR